MQFIEAVKTVPRKYVVYQGRASRSEYWYWCLFTVIAGFVLGIVDGVLGTHAGKYGLLGMVFSLAILLPNIMVTIRRLHDTNRSGLVDIDRIYHYRRNSIAYLVLHARHCRR